MAKKDIFGIVEHIALSWDIKNRCLEPLTYLVEDDRGIIVTVDLPCVKKEDIDVHITDNVLIIKARMQQAYILHRWGTIQRGVEFNSFHNAIKLHRNIIMEDIKIKFFNGILEVMIPKNTDKGEIEIN